MVSHVTQFVSKSVSKNLWTNVGQLLRGEFCSCAIRRQLHILANCLAVFETLLPKILLGETHMLDKILIEVGTVGKLNVFNELGKFSSRLPVALG